MALVFCGGRHQRKRCTPDRRRTASDKDIVCSLETPIDVDKIASPVDALFSQAAPNCSSHNNHLRNTASHTSTAHMSPNMPSQRPFFLSTFLAAFRQPSSPSLATTTSSQPNKHTTQASSNYTSAGGASAPRSIASSAHAQAQSSAAAQAQARLHSPRQHSAIPIPQQGGAGGGGAAAGSRRRGSDSSSEGFREVMGADKWYIGGRTAGGEEKFFKLGVVRRVRSGDRLSIDRLSL